MQDVYEFVEEFRAEGQFFEKDAIDGIKKIAKNYVTMEQNDWNRAKVMKIMKLVLNVERIGKLRSKSDYYYSIKSFVADDLGAYNIKNVSVYNIALPV
jgi:hypothetical protein